MNIKQIANYIKRAGKKLTMNKSLISVTDDPRIAIDSKEFESIKKAYRMYKGDFGSRTITNSLGQKKSQKIHGYNLTEIMSSSLASIVFNEQAEINVSQHDKEEQETAKENQTTLDEPVNDKLQEIFKQNDFKHLLERYIDGAIATGGFAIRPIIDGDRIKISWIRADQFLPLSYDADNISEACIVNVHSKTINGTRYYYTLLEFHQWMPNGDYKVTNELYKSDVRHEVGKQVPLGEYYADENGNATLRDESVFTGLGRPMFAYFRIPGNNLEYKDSPLGYGFANKGRSVLEDTIDTHDEMYWDMKFGKRRVAVPAEWLRHDDEHKAYFDVNQAVYEGMYTNGDDSLSSIKDLTSELRPDQFDKYLDIYKKELESIIGVSSGTISSADQSMQTATEIESNNSKTYRTRASFLTNLDKFIKESVLSIIQLGNYGELFESQQPLFDFDITKDENVLDFDVHYDDGVFVDKNKQFSNDLQAFSAQALPLKEFLKRNYGLDDKSATAWLTELRDELPESEPQEQDFGE